MKKIKFVAVNKTVEENIPMPKPAKFYIPDWYKETTYFYDSNKLNFPNGPEPELTYKACIPFFDALTFGYIQETWCDIHIDVKDDGSIECYYSYSLEDLQIVGGRDIRALGKMPAPQDCHEIFFHWAREWNPVLPKGYSALIVHPLQREDLPFKVMSGIIDSDIYYLNGKVGFFIKRGFSGVIPKGTPMYQIIPFKRDSWKSEKLIVNKKYKNILSDQYYNLRSKFTGSYKHNYWIRKDFK